LSDPAKGNSIPSGVLHRGGEKKKKSIAFEGPRGACTALRAKRGRGRIRALWPAARGKKNITPGVRLEAKKRRGGPALGFTAKRKKPSFSPRSPGGTALYFAGKKKKEILENVPFRDRD